MSFKKMLGAAALMSLSIGMSRPAFAEPAFTVQGEEAAHPRLVDAIHKMKEALHELEAAPADFGGNKAAAIADTRKAIHSLRRALYFRMKLDDGAIDRME